MIRKGNRIYLTEAGWLRPRYPLNNYLPYLYFGAWFAGSHCIGCQCGDPVGAKTIEDNCTRSTITAQMTSWLPAGGLFRIDAADPGEISPPHITSEMNIPAGCQVGRETTVLILSELHTWTRAGLAHGPPAQI